MREIISYLPQKNRRLVLRMAGSTVILAVPPLKRLNMMNA